MEYDASELSRDECLALLRTVPFGRLAFRDGELPAIVPVSFVLDSERIVVHTRGGSSVSRAGGPDLVAFQVDDVDVTGRAGWTVTVVGRAALVTDEIDLERLAELPLLPFVPGEKTAYLTVSVDVVTGRRFGGPEPSHEQARGQ